MEPDQLVMDLSGRTHSVSRDTRPEPRDQLEPLDQRYAEWRQTENGKWVFSSVAWRALRLKQRGWKHYGIAAIFEVVRYASDMRAGPDGEGFKANNSYRSRLAREVMATYSELDGFFELRRLHS